LNKITVKLITLKVFLVDNLSYLFSHLEKQSPMPSPESLVQLSLVFHSLLQNESHGVQLAIALRERPIYWFTKGVTENSSENEMLLTEPC
jgi:hypothetical protein